MCIPVTVVWSELVRDTVMGTMKEVTVVSGGGALALIVLIVLFVPKASVLNFGVLGCSEDVAVVVGSGGIVELETTWSTSLVGAPVDTLPSTLPLALLVLSTTVPTDEVMELGIVALASSSSTCRSCRRCSCCRRSNRMPSLSVVPPSAISPG